VCRRTPNATHTLYQTVTNEGKLTHPPPALLFLIDTP
jgi:hypothetical protein